MSLSLHLRPFDPRRQPRSNRVEGLPENIDRFQRLEIEIGCGVGMHPLQRAAHLATEGLNTAYIAIEHTQVRFGKFHHALQKLRMDHPGALPGLFPRHTNAISWISHHVKPATVDHYWIMYPNPYPKKVHLNRRWHAMPFMRYLLTTLKPGGRVTLVTNMKFYADEAKFYFQQAHGLHLEKEIQILGKNALESGFQPRTHFEKKYLERNEVCYELELSRSRIFV